MPIHDWTRVSAGVFHHFHQGWIVSLANALNSGQLPPNHFALAEQVVGGPIPDVLALELAAASGSKSEKNGGVALATAAPRTRFVLRSAAQRYARKANRVAVRHETGRVVAVIEIVSPGNKDSRAALRAFVEKANALLAEGIHLVVVDLFPPSPRDPEGINKAIWDEIEESPFQLPPDKRLSLASFCGGAELAAYLEPVAAGDVLPDMPLFLTQDGHVPLRLEDAYQTTWSAFPAVLKPALEAE